MLRIGFDRRSAWRLSLNALRRTAAKRYVGKSKNVCAVRRVDGCSLFERMSTSRDEKGHLAG